MDEMLKMLQGMAAEMKSLKADVEKSKSKVQSVPVAKVVKNHADAAEDYKSVKNAEPKNDKTKRSPSKKSVPNYALVSFPTNIKHSYKKEHHAVARWLSESDINWKGKAFRSINAFATAHNQVLLDEGNHPKSITENVWDSGNVTFKNPDGEWVALATIVTKETTPPPAKANKKPVKEDNKKPVKEDDEVDKEDEEEEEEEPEKTMSPEEVADWVAEVHGADYTWLMLEDFEEENGVFIYPETAVHECGKDCDFGIVVFKKPNEGSNASAAASGGGGGGPKPEAKVLDKNGKPVTFAAKFPDKSSIGIVEGVIKTTTKPCHMKAESTAEQVAIKAQQEGKLDIADNTEPKPKERKPVKELIYNEAADCFIDTKGNCFYADLDETTLDPIPDMGRKIGTIKAGVKRKDATSEDIEFCSEEEYEAAHPVVPAKPVGPKPKAEKK